MNHGGLIGVDVIEVDHFRRFHDSASEAQLAEVFTERERRDVAKRRSPEIGLAARFAAKEAVIKVLEHVDPFALDWTQIEIIRSQSGRPVVRLYGSMADLAKTLGITAIEVSMSHSATIAIAQALAVRS